MKLTRTARRRAPETIIALIDVVFFLLVFFMLVGRMDATAPFEVVPPTARGGTDMPGGGATVAVSAEGRLALDGTPLSREELLQTLATQVQGDPGLLIRINADRAAQLRKVLPLVGEIEALGAQDIVLVLTPAAP